MTAADRAEPLGTKLKSWVDHPVLASCLCKLTRPNTGEDWSEKVASELARVLLLPHAQYELGTYNDSLPCVLSPNFVPKGCSLIHGNELLGRVFPLDGSRVSRFHQTTHTIDGVFDALQQSDCEMPLNWDPPKDLTTAYEVLPVTYFWTR